MLKHIKPYKIDVGDTIIFRGTHASREDDLFKDNSNIDLAGQRLLVVDIEYSEEEGNYCLYLRCNLCEKLHDIWISDDEMNNTFVTVFRDDSKNHEYF
jgi:hypothetical protein